MADPRADHLSAEVTRVADRLRALGHARLARPIDAVAGTGSVADAAHAIAQDLADLAADAEGRPRRPVPRLADHAAGDQVAVTGHDLVAVADRLPPQLLAVAADRLTSFRRALP
ncbi:MAG TPA: hypothetical protein VK894_12140 [Jiangellales bacterium]|nr:hypothetical protein [Jiangellales bacterium]